MQHLKHNISKVSPFANNVPKRTMQLKRSIAKKNMFLNDLAPSTKSPGQVATGNERIATT
jgi:hypothetical protein